MANKSSRGITQTIDGNDNIQIIQEIVADKEYFDKIILGKYPSIINQVVVCLFEHITKEIPSTNGIPEYSPADKIEHNGVVKYKDVIHAYGEYTQFLENAFEALESDTPGRKRRFLFFIHMEYLKLVGTLQANNPTKSKIEVIRENADQIIDDMINKLMITVATDETSTLELSKEELIVCIETIVCHAFVECKILENPNVT